MERREIWTERPEELLPRYVAALERGAAFRQAFNDRMLELYYGLPLPIFEADDRTRYAGQYFAIFDQLEELGENLMREVVDGSIALTVRKLQCKVQPTGADDYETQRSCELLGFLVDAVLEESDFHDLALQATKDGHLCDVGPLEAKLTEQGAIEWERGEPNLLLWSKDRKGDPRTMVGVNAVPRENAADLYPKHADKIFGDLGSWAPKPIQGVDDFTVEDVRTSDTIRIYDATYKKLGGKKGLRVVATERFVLDVENWDFEDHPRIAYRWSRDHSGFGGCSLARVISRDHIWCNNFIQATYRALRGSGPKIVYDPMLVPNPQWSDEDYDLIPAEGGPASVQVLVPQVVDPEWLKEYERRRVRAFAKGGVNPSMAAGIAPPNLDSGKAQREAYSAASARLLPQNRALESLYRDAAKVVIMLTAQLLERRKGIPVRSPTGDFVREITLDDVKALLESKKYKVSFGLVSGLSLDPSGRLQDLKELSQLLPQHVDAAMVAANLDLPDTQAIAQRVNSGPKLIGKLISLALHGGPDRKPKVEIPDSSIDLQQLVTRATDELNLARLQGTHPKANLSALWRLREIARGQMVPPPTAPVASLGPMGTATPDSMRAVDALTPGSPPIAPPVTTAAPPVIPAGPPPPVPPVA